MNSSAPDDPGNEPGTDYGIDGWLDSVARFTDVVRAEKRRPDNASHSGNDECNELAPIEVEPAPIEVVDWETLRIQETKDDEGRIEMMNEDTMFRLLGLRDDDVEQERPRTSAQPSAIDDLVAVISDDTAAAALQVDDTDPDESIIRYDKDNPQMELGTLYPSMQEFRLAVRQYAINEEFELGIEKTDKIRYRGYCKGEGCNWRIVGHRRSDLKTIVVTVLQDEHLCRSSCRLKTRNVTSKWVAERALPILRREPNLSAVDLHRRLQSKYLTEMSYDTVWKGQQMALTEMYGSWEDSFQMLYRWRAEVLKRSPGSVVEVDTKVVDDRVYFHRFFCALKPCIEGFLKGCRPYISIDSTALNGRWNGHLAAATALDGHNWMYPLAFGFIDSETEDNWVWWMSQLNKALGDVPLLAICTDACKGLENAVDQVFPNAEKRECFRHLMQNFMKKFHGAPFGQMYPAARAYRSEVFDEHMQSILNQCPQVLEYLQKYHPLRWMRCMFNPDIKCDYINNNLAECFNNWIKDFKDLPVVDLADKIREMIMVLWERRRRIGERLSGRMLPAIMVQLNARTRGLGHLRVVKSDNEVAEVWDNSEKQERHIVKITLMQCTCLEWQHTGMPCEHGLAVLTTNKSYRLEDYVHEYYTLDKYKAAYANRIEPLTDKSQWPSVELLYEVGAPLGKRPVGRQRKLRFKSAREGGSKSASVDKKKKTMIRGPIKCKRCGELGHRQASYKCPMNGTKKRTRKPRARRYAGANEPPAAAAAEQISPGVVTRSRISQLLGVGRTSNTDGASTSSAAAAKTSTAKKTTPKKPQKKKMTPKKMKN